MSRTSRVISTGLVVAAGCGLLAGLIANGAPPIRPDLFGVVVFLAMAWGALMGAGLTTRERDEEEEAVELAKIDRQIAREAGRIRRDEAEQAAALGTANAAALEFGDLARHRHR